MNVGLFRVRPTPLCPKGWRRGYKPRRALRATERLTWIEIDGREWAIYHHDPWRKIMSMMNINNSTLKDRKCADCLSQLRLSDKRLEKADKRRSRLVPLRIDSSIISASIQVEGTQFIIPSGSLDEVRAVAYWLKDGPGEEQTLNGYRVVIPC